MTVEARDEQDIQTSCNVCRDHTRCWACAGVFGRVEQRVKLQMLVYGSIPFHPRCAQAKAREFLTAAEEALKAHTP